MARCPECNKFTGKNVDEEPEVTSDLEIGQDGSATMSVKIVNQCEECSTEIEENEFNLEGTVNVSEHQGEGHELDWDDPEIERTDSGGRQIRQADVRRGGEGLAQLLVRCPDTTLRDEGRDSVLSNGVTDMKRMVKLTKGHKIECRGFPQSASRASRCSQSITVEEVTL